MSLPRVRKVVRGAWIAAAMLALLAGPSCSDARKRKKEPAPAPPPAADPAAPAPVATPPAPVTPPAPAATPAAPAAPPSAPAEAPKGLDPKDAPHATTFEIRLTPPIRLGGISLAVTFDPEKFVAAEPKTADALTGFTCLANLAPPGSVRWSCAGLVEGTRSGALATIDVRGRERAPTAADLVVTRVDLADKDANTVTDAKVELVAASPAPAPAR